ncbi:MAG TPA: R3H domain-containing nucleic acid-binding protein [Candidatus Baltobacteraceae bacterium]|nr:R3H domain-containing nucleic acid-binding protein [Candidatus Baltobacteraceae bacterium]
MLYEDDYEYEEQPANIRDRQIPGKTTGERTGASGGGGGRRGGSGGGGGGRRGGGGGYGNRRGGGGYQHTPRERSTHELPDDAKPARDLLASILNQMGMEHVDIGYIPRKEGEYLEVTGPDLAMLIGRHGNTLEALNLIFNNIINAGVRNNRRYYTIDAEGYRARRADQLTDLAIASAERVLRDGKPHKLEPMLPSERKIVHLAIADNPAVRTESEGEEPERCVVIFPT